MDALIDRQNTIDPVALAALLGETPPAPFEEQARSYLAHKALGAHMEAPLVRALVRAGRLPTRGKALGTETGATFRNSPHPGYVIAPQVFEDATIRQTWKTASKPFRGFGLKEEGWDLPSRGVLAELELIFTGTWTRTDGTGAVTPTDYNPYGLWEWLSLSVNGSDLKNASGMAYEYRRQVLTRKAVDAMTSAPNAAGANVWDVRWRIPVADNLRNLWGGILAQADDLDVRLDVMTAAKNKMAALTGTADVTLTGQTELLIITYDVPIVNIEGVGERHVLPDTDVLHRFHEFSEAVPAVGEKVMDLQRTAGEVERIFVWLDNASSTLMDPASWSEVRFRYMSTEEPLRFPAKSLLSENARNYTNRITPKAAVIDLSAYNQRRDGLFPRETIDPQIVVVIPAGVTVNAGARLFAVQESLVGGA
jgi:hypothetical protein